MKNKSHYRNRYGDVFTFEVNERGNVTWSGNFNHSRCGFPNDYDEAFSCYLNDGGSLKFSEFKKEVHRYNYDQEGNYLGPSDVARDYGKLVKSKKEINMVDPSGGPYIVIGTDMSRFGLSGTVSGFIVMPDGYEIVIGECPVCGGKSHHKLGCQNNKKKQPKIPLDMNS